MNNKYIKLNASELRELFNSVEKSLNSMEYVEEAYTEHDIENNAEMQRTCAEYSDIIKELERRAASNPVVSKGVGKLEAEGSFCCLSKESSYLNGIEIDIYEFGEKYNRSSSPVEYACGDMRFTRIPFTDAVLTKYGISKEDYSLVCEQLEEVLSFGHCSLCE
jgi:hypothetical protein